MSDYRIDVAVMGGGLSGMTAALRAAQAGLKVAVFEKGEEELYLCATRLTAGVFHICMQDIRLGAEKLTPIIARQVGDFASPELIAMMAGEPLRAIKWLQEAGASFIRGAAHYQSFMLAPPNVVRVGASWEGRGGDVTLRGMEKRLIAAGSQVLRGHAVNGLLVENGACVGLEGTGHNGPFVARASAVVLADGGFQSNPDLVRRAISQHPESMVQRNARRSFGGALHIAEAVGADITPLDGFYGHVQARGAIENDRLWPYPWLDDLLCAGIVIGPDGQRFTDEGLGGTHVANSIARLEDPLSAVVVFDAVIWETAGRMRGLAPNPNLEAAGATVHRAPTIEALAGLAGIPADALAAEIKRHNDGVAAGSFPDRSPHPEAKPMPIAKGPFYAIPACAGITYTMGGPRIDSSCRVQAQSGEPIPGLYAVGSASGGIEGGRVPGYIGGLIKAAITGLRAAEHIAANRAA
jgi:fumarate reductase flavoprotein subunit